MENENFTIQQIEGAKKTLQRLYECNTKVGSDCKIENIKMFKDSKNNLYMSYLSTFFGADGNSVDVYYIKINQDGSQEVLNYVYSDRRALIEKFEKLTPITF